MPDTVDLNADMGESYGDWNMGNDPALLDIVTSANIACGFHAGDPNVMARTMDMALKKGVGIGAHPGFPDLQGFGRRRMTLPQHTLANIIQYQLGAAMAMASAAGGALTHFKLHGALGNMATEDADLARTCYRAALDIVPDITILVLSATPMQTVTEELGCNWAGEIFADRAYNDDASLVDRSKPGAVLHDAEVAAKRMCAMVKENAIITESGKRIPTCIDTICMHGDTDGAVNIARAVRSALEADGIQVRKLADR